MLGLAIVTKHDCEIVVADRQSLCPEQEAIEDLLTIVHSFSSQLC